MKTLELWLRLAAEGRFDSDPTSNSLQWLLKEHFGVSEEDIPPLQKDAEDLRDRVYKEHGLEWFGTDLI